MTIIRLADDDRDMITISIYDLQAAISASPVHDDILKIWVALADYRSDRRLEVSGAIIVRRYDTDPRERAIMIR
jgi:hypothetical protein